MIGPGNLRKTIFASAAADMVSDKAQYPLELRFARIEIVLQSGMGPHFLVTHAMPLELATLGETRPGRIHITASEAGRHGRCWRGQFWRRPKANPDGRIISRRRCTETERLRAARSW